MDGSVRIPDTSRGNDNEDIQQCTTTNCVLDADDSYKLECIKCNREVHYKCTHLPLYQLSLFLTTGYRRFVCENCVEVPQYLKENPTIVAHTLYGCNQTLDDFTTTLNKKEDENKRQKEKIHVLITKQEQMLEDFQNQEKEFRESRNMLERLQWEITKYERSIKSYEESESEASTCHSKPTK